MRVLLVCGLLGLLEPQVHANYGGHDLFTSLGQLKELWRNDRKIVADMRKAIDAMDTMKEVFQRYISSHESIQLDQDPSIDYLGQPLNGYFLIRHVAMGWSEVMERLYPLFNETHRSFETFLTRHKEKLPDNYDVQGAAFGIVRLHSLYKLNATEMMTNGVIATEKTDTGENIKARSKPSVAKLSAWDALIIASEAFKTGFYRTTVDSFPFVLSKLAEEKVTDEKPFEAFSSDVNVNETFVKLEMRKAYAIHDQILDRRGPVGGAHRTHLVPLDAKLRKKKKYKKPKGYSLGTPLRSEVEAANTRKSDDADLSLKSQMQMEMLCAGEPIRDPMEDATLKSFYAHNHSPWLKLGPMKVEVRNKKPYLAVLRQYMYEHECDNITKFLEPTLDFPPGRMSTKARKNDWTMKNTWPIEDHNIYLEKMTRRVEHISGLLAASNKEQSDAFMCGNYGIGGHYGIHPDFHHYDETAFYDPSRTINRVSTVMTVLDAPIAGGATVFPYLGVSVFPEKGSAAFWFNTKEDAVPDPLTLHSACPVLLGQKWIGNKWIRYRAQWQKRPCGLKAEGHMQGPLPEFEAKL